MVAKKALGLTFAQSKEARSALTLSQKGVIEQAGIQAYKLKQFEAGNFRLDIADQKKLRDFYVSQGVDFDEVDATLAAQREDVRAEAEPRSGMTRTAGAGFLIADDVSQDQVDRVLDRLEENDARIAELIATGYTAGFFGDVSDETEAATRELFGTLAESHLLFRFLQGKNIVTAVTDEPKTIGDVLSKWVQDSPAFDVLGIAPGEGNAPAKPKAKVKPTAMASADESEG